MLPAFTLHTPPKDLDDTVAATLEHLGKGQVSDMAITADKGYLVYALDKKLPVASASNPRFAEVRAQLAAYSAQGTAGGYFTEMASQELKRIEPAAAKRSRRRAMNSFLAPGLTLLFSFALGARPSAAGWSGLDSHGHRDGSHGGGRRPRALPAPRCGRPARGAAKTDTQAAGPP